MNQRLHAIVKGTVQGVGYREFAVRRAMSLGLTGWVMNLPDGDVRVVAEGESYNLDQFVELLKRGPFGAHVREVIAVRQPATGEFHEFRIEYP